MKGIDIEWNHPMMFQPTGNISELLSSCKTARFLIDRQHIYQSFSVIKTKIVQIAFLADFTIAVLVKHLEPKQRIVTKFRIRYGMSILTFETLNHLAN